MDVNLANPILELRRLAIWKRAAISEFDGFHEFVACLFAYDFGNCNTSDLIFGEVVEVE